MFSSTNTGGFEEDGHFISTTSLYFDLDKNVNQYPYTTYNVALWVSRCKPTYMYVVVWLENKPVHVQKSMHAQSTNWMARWASLPLAQKSACT